MQTNTHIFPATNVKGLTIVVERGGTQEWFKYFSTKSIQSIDIIFILFFFFLSHSSLQIEWVICPYICLAIRDMKINWGSVRVYIMLDLDQFQT